MPNPPTVDDLKRRRYTGKYKLPKRFKIIPTSIQLFTIPTLTNPFTDLDILGTETYDSLATETLSVLAVKNYTNTVSITPSSFEFYTNGPIIFKPIRYPYDSLWYVDNEFDTKSVSLTTKSDEEGIFKIQRQFFGAYSDDLLTSSYTFTGYNFKNLNVNLSADKTSLITETEKIGGDNISFINKLSSGKFIDSSVQFQIDYDHNGDVSPVFDSLDVVNAHTYTFTDTFTGTKTITLSTIRNDGLSGTSIASIPIYFQVSTPIWLRVSRESIATTWQTISSVPNPGGEEDKFRFLNFEGGENTGTELISGEWNTEWWGYSARDLYNFSGVSYNIRGPGKPGDYKDENNVTLITPRHGVCNTHWAPSETPSVGDSMYFYDHTTGMSVSAEVEAVSATGVQDITMVKYDRDLTALGDIKVYKLPLFTSPVNRDIFCTIYQGGKYPFGTSDRYAGLGTHYLVSQEMVDASLPPVIGDNIGAISQIPVHQLTRFWSVSSIFENTFFGLSGLEVGDSSSPGFIITDDDILLLQTFTTKDGLGPNYGISAIHTLLSSGIETLGNTEGYTLSTVKIS